LLGGRNAAGAIEQIEFDDGTRWTSADLAGRAELLPDNRAPLMPESLGSVTVDPGNRLSYAIPPGEILDPDRFDSLTFYAITAEGNALPDWLSFDAATLTLSGTPSAADVGNQEVVLVAVDQSGAASLAALTINIAGDDTPPPVEPPLPAEPPAPTGPAAVAGFAIAADIPPAPAPVREISIASAEIPAAQPVSPRVGVPADPLFRDMQQRFDVLLQTGRTNLGERYAEAVREFEQRRQQREEPPPPPPPADEEVEAWNSAMHSWHDRNPGFAETELGGNDGTWSIGWGLPGPGDNPYGGAVSAGALPGLANPLINSRLTGAASAPMLGEGLRDVR
jgi:hypothetical protein